jgi:hypothetical protein
VVIPLINRAGRGIATHALRQQARERGLTRGPLCASCNDVARMSCGPQAATSEKQFRTALQPRPR